MTQALMILPVDGPEFWSKLQHEVNEGYSMEYIAKKFGWNVRDLCDWMLAYNSKDYPPAKAYANRDSPPMRKEPAHKANARLFKEWQRTREAAQQALGA